MVGSKRLSIDTPHEGGSPVREFSSMFSQLLKLFPRTEFQALVKRTLAERHARGFTCWGQFVAMLFCQLGRAHSLREICGGLRSGEGKLKHLGITAPSRSTLAYANEHRPWQLYRAVFQELLGRCQAQMTGRRKLRFKNKLVSLDSTVIDLCATLFDWAKFRRTKGAIKLHCLLDHDGYLPSVVVITEGKRHDVRVARTLRFDPGTIVVMDRGYVDFAWFGQWTALIAILLLKYLQLRSRFGWSLSNLVALLRMNLFTHRDLWAWLDHPFEGPPTVLLATQSELALA